MFDPTQRMREMFSGVPRDKRARRIIVALQAYIDDSQTDDEVLVMAGYVASFERWEAFSKDWQERLDMRPQWASFKMAEVMASGSEQTMERASWFYRVIEDHAQAWVACAIDIKALRRATNELGMSRRIIDNQYIWAIKGIIDSTLLFSHEIGLNEPVDFIFDMRGEKKHVRAGWETYEAFMLPHLKPFLGREPRFEDDHEFLPLQAADMLAWVAREHWLTHKTLVAGRVSMPWREKVDIPGHRFNFGYPDLRRALTDLQYKMVAAGLLPVTVLRE